MGMIFTGRAVAIKKKCCSRDQKSARSVWEQYMLWLMGTAYLWFRRQLASFWLRQLADIPKPAYNVVETSATRAVHEFMQSKALGAAVFWAVPDAGKTAAVTNCDGSRVLLDWNYCIRPLDSARGPLGNGERISYTDAIRLLQTENGKANAVAWFNDKIGGFDRIGDCFAHAFTTVILDHYDRAMDSDESSAMQLIRRLTADSVQSGNFNVLVVLNDPRHALSLLQMSLWHMRLLGPAFCGKCKQDELEQLGGLTELAMDVGLQSGAIGMAASVQSMRVSDDIQYLYAVQTGKLWDVGESLLRSYRSATV